MSGLVCSAYILEEAKGSLMDRSEIKHFLKGCEFFKGFQKDNIQEITNLCQMKTYGAGDHIFRQGDLGDSIYIVIEGHVFLERSVDLGTRKGSVVIGVLSKGRVFGCWSTLLNEKHTLLSSAFCRKATKVLVIKGPDLRKIMLDNNKLGFYVLERLCFLLRDRLMGVYEAMENF
ncbi:MAG: cyclic nucleotide-binding domain-containing protein [Syntrophobacterales bacterium]